MVRFSDQKISISTQNFISTHVWKPTNSWTMCSFYLCAPDATTVAYKQKYRNSWAIFSWTSLINLFFFLNHVTLDLLAPECLSVSRSGCPLVISHGRYRTIKCQPSTMKSNEEKKVSQKDCSNNKAPSINSSSPRVREIDGELIWEDIFSSTDHESRGPDLSLYTQWVFHANMD